MPFVSITRLRLRSARFLPGFLWFSLLSTLQAKRSPGNLGMSGLRDANLAFWTATLWENEAAMRVFMLSGAHRRAMPKLARWADEAAVAHWTQDCTDLPDWTEAHRRLSTEGCMSKVNHPSPRQLAREIPAPRV
ncbi:MAG: DUF3291 domain-containing protein [Bryobacteraceae bacterium]